MERSEHLGTISLYIEHRIDRADHRVVIHGVSRNADYEQIERYRASSESYNELDPAFPDVADMVEDAMYRIARKQKGVWRNI